VPVGGGFYDQAQGHSASRVPCYTGYCDSVYVVTPNEADIASSNEHRAGHSFHLVGWDDSVDRDHPLRGHGLRLRPDDAVRQPLDPAGNPGP